MTGFIRKSARVLVSIGVALAVPVTAQSPSTASPPIPQSVTAKKAAKGTIKVTLTGPASYVVKGKGYRKVAASSKTFRVRPGKYTFKAPSSAVVTPASVKVKAGKTVKVRIEIIDAGAVDPPPTPSPTPTPPPPPPPEPRLNPGTLASGDRHTCAIDTDGKAWCWGLDSYGQLGDGADGNAVEYSPVEVAGGHTFVWISASGYSTCGIDTDGKAWCWGKDDDGEVGDGIADQTTKSSPVAVDTDTKFVQLAGGDTTTCAIDTTGKAWCWGSDADGQLGDGNDDGADATSPVSVASAAKFTDLSLGSTHACGVADDSILWCWGSDADGQLGDGDDGQGVEYAPIPIPGQYAHVAAQSRSTCAIAVSGTSWCWGSNGAGQLGIGNNLPATAYSPAEVTGDQTFTAVRGGPGNICALTAGGQAWCWGDNSRGQIGIGGTSPLTQNSPAAVLGTHTFTHMSLGISFVCALDNAGKAWCWGWDINGTLGDGDPTGSDAYQPRAVAGGHTFARTY